MDEQESPDVRDGLTRKQRIVLLTLHELVRERGGRAVKLAMLYGRVLERAGAGDISQAELLRILTQLGIRRR